MATIKSVQIIWKENIATDYDNYLSQMFHASFRICGDGGGGGGDAVSD